MRTWGQPTIIQQLVDNPQVVKIASGLIHEIQLIVDHALFRCMIRKSLLSQPNNRIHMASKASDFQQLIRGASINQLGQLFDLDRRTVADRLKDVQPCGTRSTFPIYKISEVAELLVVGYMGAGKLSEAQKLKRAGSEKDYWDSQLKRQKYMENMGDLWRTEKVIEVFADVFKLFRETVVVFADEMEHESGLSNAQIEKVKGFCDGLLIEVQSKLVGLEIPEEGDHDTVDLGDDPTTTNEDDDLVALGLV